MYLSSLSWITTKILQVETEIDLTLADEVVEMVDILDHGPHDRVVRVLEGSNILLFLCYSNEN